jgi:hypothetical protein
MLFCAYNEVCTPIAKPKKIKAIIGKRVFICVRE